MLVFSTALSAYPHSQDFTTQLFQTPQPGKPFPTPYSTHNYSPHISRCPGAAPAPANGPGPLNKCKQTPSQTTSKRSGGGPDYKLPLNSTNWTARNADSPASTRTTTETWVFAKVHDSWNSQPFQRSQYDNVPTYDEEAIRVRGARTDFVHASRILAANNRGNYIVAQLPLVHPPTPRIDTQLQWLVGSDEFMWEKMLSNFRYRMVWSHEVSFCVCLVNLINTPHCGFFFNQNIRGSHNVSFGQLLF